MISYEGKNAKELLSDFHSAIDSYLKLCEDEGAKPETAYKGSFSVRISPELCKKAVIYAIRHNTTLNSCVEIALQKAFG